ncbi:heterokaryon incompatibility protein-domain-containing protein [Lasiosphaeria miniovina]|uniref:Heterokaryon incompatibility protein-domain-containing protein n=1 Tax=Lasiosphaeria miniovina TaxID=1954250 RepID=A0AA40DU29_9PEZI|nr:heterokaryon incompatibility protein-domain-containing protein [Lasiosphaeria miniovina]KAK0713392.1 heterokaryon incompatibility protein-domain-containing protein [Lasiosphaeria miniovina]
MSLCGRCRQILQAIEIKVGSPAPAAPGHHRSVLEYLAAVDARCYICWKAYRGLGASLQEHLRRLEARLRRLQLDGNVATTWFSLIIFSSIQQPTGHTLSIWVRALEDYALGVCSDGLLDDSWTADDAKALHVEIGTAANTQDYTQTVLLCIEDERAKQAVKQRLPASRRTDSPETFELIQQWLRDCLAHHTACNNSPENRDHWRPTRLLEIGDVDGEGGVSSCRLVDGRDAARDSRGYVTLSHRWGTTNLLTLTADNLVCFRTGLPLESLSRAFLEGMLVARRLGIRHIWIDSLCIVQSGDGGRDWLHESAQMHLVYRSAFCNIMADSATASHDGLFFDRDLRLFDRLSVDLAVVETSPSPSGSLLVRKRFASVEQGLWGNHVSRSPLNRRGWVLQERLLSRRNLHFCAREVFWECRELACCESAPDRDARAPHSAHLAVPDDELHLKTLQPRLAAGSVPSPTEGDGDSGGMQHYMAWRDIVRTYSRGELTKVSDKLMALGGIARHMKAVLGGDDVYVAGLWLRQIAAEVLWMRLDPRHWADWRLWSHEHPAPDAGVLGLPSDAGYFDRYQAPSFSWASVNNPHHGVMPGDPLSRGILVDARCVRLRPPEAAAGDVSHDGPRGWEDEPIVEDIFGPLSAPPVELKVVGRVMPARLVPVPSPDDADSGDCSVLRLQPLGCDEPAAHQQDKTSAVVMVCLDRAVPRAEAAAFCQKRYYFVPWQDDRPDDSTGTAASLHAASVVRFRCVVLELVDAEMARFRRIGLFIKTRSVSDDVYLRCWGRERDVPSWGFDEATEEHTIYVV